jgi:hypothetical protein
LNRVRVADVCNVSGSWDTAEQQLRAYIQYARDRDLPYRLHAKVEQFYRAYPQAQRFFELKRKYDPDELFQNELYRKYNTVSGN